MATALFVDDTDLACKMARRHFGEVLKLEFAHSVPIALQMLIEQHFDLFMLDYKLPEGSGIDLARTIRGMDQYKDTPILLLSASMTDDVAYGAMKSGVNASFCKLTPSSAIIEEIKAQLRQPYIKTVALERIETRCLSWKKDTLYFEYAPELGLTVCGVSRSDAHDKMRDQLATILSSRKDIDVFADDIELTTHLVKL